MAVAFKFDLNPKELDRIKNQMNRIMEKKFYKHVHEENKQILDQGVKLNKKRWRVQPGAPQNKPQETRSLNPIIYIGAEMEKLLIDLEDVNAEVSESKKLLQQSLEDITAMRQLSAPEFSKYVQEIRSNRAAIERETKSMLAEMKEIRNFFADPKVQKDIEQMRSFVNTVYSLKALAHDNLLNAIVDAMLKMQKQPID